MASMVGYPEGAHEKAVRTALGGDRHHQAEEPDNSVSYPGQPQIERDFVGRWPSG